MMAAEEASAEHISQAKTPGEVNGIYILEHLVSLRAACNMLNDEKTGFNCLIPHYHPTSPFHGNISIYFSFRTSS